MFCCTVSKKCALNYSETLRQKTLSVSPPAEGLVATHSHDKAADVEVKFFFFFEHAEMLRVVRYLVRRRLGAV